MIIRGTTQLLGVIGYPIKHSMSPVMHNAALATLGLDFAYVPFAIAPTNLADAIKGFAAIGVQGFSITIPHKQTIIPLLSEVSDVAKAIGAVNTVWRTEQGWAGTNTDALGFMAPLQALDRNWPATQAMVLGNGGAARAIVAALHQLGCPAIQVFGRSPDKLEAFAQSWQTSPLQPNLSVHSWQAIDTYLPSSGIVVNTTPMGMAPATEDSPLSLEQMATLSDQAIVYDLIYTPRPTRFLALASAVGLTTFDGLEMLVQQGAAALEIWVKQPVPVDVMRDALLKEMPKAH
jgi:shikimate dehydrogenase